MDESHLEMVAFKMNILPSKENQYIIRIPVAVFCLLVVDSLIMTAILNSKTFKKCIA